MKQLFIHIGHQKCGSTTIQKWFDRHQEALDAVGVRYVRSGRGGPVHHPFAIQLHQANPPISAGKPRDHFADLDREIADTAADAFVISAESFVGQANQSKIEELRAKLPSDVEVHIVLIVRRQYDWLPSQWAQLAKCGTSLQSYDEWYAHIVPHRIRTVDYQWLTNLWSESSQPATLHVLSFEDLVAHPSGLITAFMQALGLSLPPNDVLQDCEPQNISPTYETVLFCQSFFAAIEAREPNLWQMLKQNGFSRVCISDMLQEFIAGQGWRGGAKQWTTFDRKQEIFNYYKDSNYEMVQRFSALDKFKLFLAPPIPEPIDSINHDRIARQSALLPDATFFVMSQLIRETYFKPQR